MHIVLLCATQRGYLFLKKLVELSPESKISVFSFREEPWEPPYIDNIRSLALSIGGDFFETRQVGHLRWAAFWESGKADLMFAVSWRYMIPPSVYRRPCLGTFIFHDSLLPKYRGFSPTVWSVINGENSTGVTLFEVAKDVDSGDIIDQKRVVIDPDDYIAEVLERVTQAYLDLLESNLHKLTSKNAPRFSQDHASASYTCKRLPEDNLINWTESSEKIFNLIRGVSAPYPGAYTWVSGKKLYVWSAKRMVNCHHYVGRVPGRVVEVRPGEGSVVLTGDGLLMLTQVQMDGGQIVCASDVLNRHSCSLGH